MFEIVGIPAFDDNYIWLIKDDITREAFVVDPGDATCVNTALSRENLILTGILITHHHLDHTGGIEALTSATPVPVYGPESTRIPQISDPLHDGDILTVGQSGLSLKVIAVPGHTLDHIAFYIESLSAVFCGDTLFAAGCGRMFEGDARQMQASLALLAQLPPETRVYCAHEYTQSNLRFAVAVEPDNPNIRDRANQVNMLRAEGLATVPSTIETELLTNPFLRWDSPAVLHAARSFVGVEISTPDEVFGALRSWKDNF